jgi:hypothetical protein
MLKSSNLLSCLVVVLDWGLCGDVLCPVSVPIFIKFEFECFQAKRTVFGGGFLNRILCVDINSCLMLVRGGIFKLGILLL